MVLVDGYGLPLGADVAPANLAECTLAEAKLANVAVQRRGPGPSKRKPARIIADRGYDSRALWHRLKARGIQLIVPHRTNRHDRYQDGRFLRRYRRRWIIERTNAWLLNSRRLTVRYERKLAQYRAFVYLVCALLALRQF